MRFWPERAFHSLRAAWEGCGDSDKANESVSCLLKLTVSTVCPACPKCCCTHLQILFKSTW